MRRDEVRSHQRAEVDLVGPELLRRYHLTNDRAARDAAFLHYRGLARGMAQRMTGRGQQLDDLLQVADLGLVSAIERFDPDRGNGFVGFAVPTILGELKKHFRDHGWGTRVPRPLKELCVRLRASADELAGQLGRSPTIAELADALDVDEDAVLEAMEAGAAYRPSSTATAEGQAHAETAGLRSATQPLDDDRADSRLTALGLLARLPARQRRIVYLRYYEDLTQSEIAAEVGLSQMHVSRLLRQSLVAMREAGPAPMVKAS